MQHELENFSDEDGLFFYFTPAGQKHLVVRKKEVYDGATPSGNAVMAHCLYYLSIIFEIPEWRGRAEAMVASLGQAIVKYPTSFGCWALALQNITEGLNEIAIVGPGSDALLKEVNKKYVPNRVLQSSPQILDKDYPLLQNKNQHGSGPLIYVCKNYACLQPVKSVAEFELIIKKNISGAVY
jgi:uncharacterized protein YyaL (SSP411 family)